MRTAGSSAPVMTASVCLRPQSARPLQLRPITTTRQKKPHIKIM